MRWWHRWLCALRGHPSALVTRDHGRVRLTCLCGYQSVGWQLDRPAPSPTKGTA